MAPSKQPEKIHSWKWDPNQRSPSINHYKKNHWLASKSLPARGRVGELGNRCREKQKITVEGATKVFGWREPQELVLACDNPTTQSPYPLRGLDEFGVPFPHEWDPSTVVFHSNSWSRVVREDLFEVSRRTMRRQGRAPTEMLPQRTRPLFVRWKHLDWVTSKFPSQSCKQIKTLLRVWDVASPSPARRGDAVSPPVL